MRRVAVIGLLVTAVLAAAPMPAAQAQDGLAYRQFATFEQSVAGDVNSFWARWSRKHGVRYDSGRLAIVPAGRYRISACGKRVADPVDMTANASPAFYCPRDDTVYLSGGWLYREIYRRYGDLAAAVAVAHEWAHHVQQVRGKHPRTVMRAELQADCWAGVWAHDAKGRGRLQSGDMAGAGQALYSMGDYNYNSPTHHGTPAQRERELRIGYRNGNPAQCDLPS
jgi:predicted metalloprotease